MREEQVREMSRLENKVEQLQRDSDNLRDSRVSTYAFDYVTLICGHKRPSNLIADFCLTYILISKLTTCLNAIFALKVPVCLISLIPT